MLDLFLGMSFLLFTIKKNSKFLIFWVDFLAIDMVLSYNGMVVKILFFSPFHYKINYNTNFRQKQASREKKNRFFLR